MERQAFEKEHGSNINEAVRIINICFNANKTRIWGLVLLQKMLKQCSTKIFEDNCLSWIRMMCTIMQSFDPPKTKNLCFLVLGQTLRHIRQFPELSREFSVSSLPTVVTTLINAKSELHASALHCLNQCMKCFSGACGPNRGKIEQFALELLETENADIQNTALTCYSLLARLGGGGSQGIKHSEGWSQLVSKVLTSMKATLCSLYQCVDLEDDSDAYYIGGMKLCSVCGEDPQRAHQLVHRYRMLCQLLIKFLRNDFPVAVNVPVQEILSIIQKSLLVTPKLLMSRPTQERVLLATSLPDVYKSSLLVLQNIIQCMCENVIPHCRSINQFILHVLTTTDMPRQYGTETPYSSVRQCAWQTLCTWLCTLGVSSGIEAVIEDFVKQILSDITPVDDTMKVQNTSSKKLSEISEHFHGKKRKKGGSSHIGQITSQRKVQENADSATCISALEGLKQILQQIGPLLNAQVYRLIVQNVISTLLKLHSHSSSTEIPYGHVDCRLKLYETIVMLVQVQHVAVAPPIQCAVNLCHFGTKDTSEKVSRYCREALISLETIIHPRAPSLYLPLIKESSQLPDTYGKLQQSIFTASDYNLVNNDFSVNTTFRSDETVLDATMKKGSKENKVSDQSVHKSEIEKSDKLTVNISDDELSNSANASYQSDHEDSDTSQNSPSPSHESSSIETSQIRKEDVLAVHKNKTIMNTDQQDKDQSSNSENVVEEPHKSQVTNGSNQDNSAKQKPITSGSKRKLDDVGGKPDNGSYKKQLQEAGETSKSDDVTERMLQSFVNAAPDSD